MGVNGILSSYSETIALPGQKKAETKEKPRDSGRAAKEEQRAYVEQRDSGSWKEELSGRAEISDSIRADYNAKGLISAGCADVPYGYLAKDGIIEYNGVVFVCDERENAICLGDMTNPDDIIRIPLSEGGCLKLNRNNIGELSRAITMFSPEDIKRILQAIALDTKIQQIKTEIDDEKSSLGKSADSAVGHNTAENDVSEAGITEGNSKTLQKEEDEIPPLDRVMLLFLDRHTERTEGFLRRDV